ncbi:MULTISPECIES: DUF6538 domain-containing protein [unclassified Bradyrhizobium]|nr:MULTISPECIES: DUF6538 domain-containing protein [unclassified Bradyrhizobium]
MSNYLRRRGHVWFFRWKWPARLAPFGLAGELVRSLKTSDFRIARRRALTLALRIETMTADLNKLPTRAEAEGLVRGWIDNCLWRRELHLAKTDGIEHFNAAEIAQMGEEDARELDGLFRFADGMFAPRHQAAIGRALAGTEPIEPYRGMIDAAAHEMGVSAGPDTLAGRVFARTILRGYATFLDELRGGIRPVPREQAVKADTSPPLKPFTFTAHWSDFEQHKLAVREWKADTASNARSSLKIFNRIFPALNVDKLISEPIAITFKTTLLQLPGNYARGKNLSKPIKALIESAKNLPISGRMQAGTANKHLNNFLEYWTYLVEQKKLPADLKNPFSGLHMPKPKGRKARDERFNWPVPLERKLFESPIYTGCSSLHRRAKPGDEIYRDAMFWMPLLARTMGARENELCDALVRNVCFEDTEEGPIPYLAILDGKDSGSIRDVPFAGLILDMGFLEQRVIGRDPDAPLFPELLPQGPGQRRSAAFTDRFSYYRRAIKVYRERIDFHSFRGNVETDLKNTAGINTAWIDELIGHESIIRRSEGDRYTKRILLPILRRLVDSISIAADLSHLRYQGVRGAPSPDRDRELLRFTVIAEREMEKKRGRRLADAR